MRARNTVVVLAHSGSRVSTSPASSPFGSHATLKGSRIRGYSTILGFHIPTCDFRLPNNYNSNFPH
ncbi:hypothetical protein V2J09_003485 [Rumex salicifolius]